MKKTIPAFLLLLLLFQPGHAQKQDFVIEGRVTGVEPGAVVSYAFMTGQTGRSYWNDNDTLTDGRFHYAHRLDSGRRFMIQCKVGEVGDGLMGLYVWGEPGMTVTITGEGPDAVGWHVESDHPEQQLSNQLNAAARAVYAQARQDNILELQTLKQGGALPSTEREPFRRRLDSLYRERDGQLLAISRHTLDVLEQTEQVSELWLEQLLLAAQRLHHLKVTDNELLLRIAACYDGLSAEHKRSPQARQIAVLLDPPTAIRGGDSLADAELRVYGGGTQRLSDFLNRGRYVVLDFWASGCGPCIDAMPEMRELTEKYNDELTIVGINMDTSDASWKMSVESYGPLTWPNLNAPPGSNVAVRYGVSAYPTLLLISPGGVVLEKWTGHGKGQVERRWRKYLSEQGTSP